jgi:phosphatidate cytidylyltransferase
MLKYRLVFGTLMTLIFAGLILLDAWIDGSLSGNPYGDKPQATLFLILICLLAVPAQMEMASLLQAAGARLFLPVAIAGSILLASVFYWPYFSNNPDLFLLYFILYSIAGILMVLFLYQVLLHGTAGTIRNCSVTFFSIFYLGFFSAFVLGIRIHQGPWAVLLYIFTIKCSDIGAYTIGKLFGRHKMAPSVSPKKTWEGLAGAIGGGVIAAYGLSAFSGIMSPVQSVLFGAGFAVLGQLGDLSESMLKRDADRKDASGTVPGFGGILDVMDSLLLPAPIAYAVFLWI